MIINDPALLGYSSPIGDYLNALTFCEWMDGGRKSQISIIFLHFQASYVQMASSWIVYTYNNSV